MKSDYIVVIFVLILAGIIFFMRTEIFPTADFSVDSTSEVESGIKEKTLIGPHVNINGVNIKVELATTSTQVQKGLSGRLVLEKDSGMLFIFPKPHLYKFWMPDMHFPVDIIWINEGRVVDIDREISNIFDPALPIFYTPSSPSQYVLEVNAGYSTAKNIEVGSPITFNGVESR